MLLKPKKLRQVYLDHAAATPLSKEVFQAMEPFFVTEYGNPSALYKLGLQANEALNNARRTIAQVLHALPDNIIFTSGGTEANNLAVFGVVKVNPHPASLS
ncbi:MAG TPA: aminotransferase class V-fold PLP-dependent enzyme, partial [Patescibacteria group bacterium]|nr:aminotransferase class V-fold PLP-dependent enzyme [Patescibacteria group bacterium]